MTEQDKVTVDDIIGIVKTEEQTNSVEEVRKLRGRENKTAKRFITNDPYGYSRIFYNHSRLDNKKVCKKLNALNEESEQLKFERDRYKRLSEIRHEIINNRILTIKEFIDNCSDKEVKKTLEQLFHSEVKEYDLSKKIRKLEKENEQLKTTIQQLTNDNTKQKKKLNTAMKENEHIKQTIKDMINTERTELGKMTLRHLWRQIQ